MSLLVTTDLHLTDKARDSYRFGLFPWLIEQAKEHNASHVLILGDLTDAKDRHSSILVDKIVKNLTKLSEKAKVAILRGNHDCVDPNLPFFQFLDLLPNIDFIVKTTVDYKLVIDKKTYYSLMLPHSRNPLRDWEDIRFGEFDFVFMHQTCEGAVASNGMEMEGITTQFFKSARGPVLSGDIHVPQSIGPVTYVGSPYRITFGDSFFPRVLLIKDDLSMSDLEYPTLFKHTLMIRDPEEIKINKELEPGDQVKVRVKLMRSQFTDWPNVKARVKQICDELKLELFAIEAVTSKPRKRLKENEVSAKGNSVADSFDRYCAREKVGVDVKKVGLSYIKETEKK